QTSEIMDVWFFILHRAIHGISKYRNRQKMRQHQANYEKQQPKNRLYRIGKAGTREMRKSCINMLTNLFEQGTMQSSGTCLNNLAAGGY
ncbi:MAG: hypothetical protein J6D53_12845, partial [Blautia sp.]|nr:hypothetical protein [Blautia sp.]